MFADIVVADEVGALGRAVGDHVVGEAVQPAGPTWIRPDAVRHQEAVDAAAGEVDQMQPGPPGRRPEIGYADHVLTGDLGADAGEASLGAVDDQPARMRQRDCWRECGQTCEAKGGFDKTATGGGKGL